jgi:excisionase family DNA binding protein
MSSSKENSLSAAPSIDRERLLSSREVCERLNICAKTLQRMCARGAISYVRISESLYRFRPSAVELFLSRAEVRTDDLRMRRRAA